MKKWIALLLLVVMVFAACQTTSAPATEAAADNANASAETAAGEITSLGFGRMVSLAKSREASDQAGPSANANVIVAAVGFDADGKIADVKIDMVQPALAYNADGTFDGEVNTNFQSKRELGDEYGMKAASGIGKEWYEQIDELETWMVGKTVDEVTGMAVTDSNNPDVPELSSSVTISVGDFQALVQEAWDNKVDAAGAVAVGAAVNATAEKSKELENDVMTAQFDTPMGVVAVDGDGKVIASALDNGQVQLQFDKEGKFVEAPPAESATKVDRGEGYGMIAASGIGKEWHEQAQAFAEWSVGKTKGDIEGIPSDTAEANDPDLSSSVTINVADFQKVLAQAIDDTAR